MAPEETARPLVVEELITEFEQRFDIDEQREEELYAQYAWEKDFDKSWEQLVDKDGVLQFVQQKSGHTPMSSFEGVAITDDPDGGIQKRSVVRNIVIVFDTSDGMREVDFKPDRLHCASGAIKGPMTQLALVALRNKRSSLIAKLGTPPSETVSLLEATIKEGAEGVPSLQNGLEMAIGILSGMPPYTTREVLVIFASTKTFDPSNILATLQRLKDEHVIVSAISIAPEMYILKWLPNGKSPEKRIDMPWMEPILTKVGFPPLEKANTASLCVCHSSLTYKTYICPQCHSKSCAIPTKCKCCGLYLVSPPDISRMFHQLIPPKAFREEPSSAKCSSCNVDAICGLVCPQCSSFYCEHCTTYIHNELHQCPFCVSGDQVELDRNSLDEVD
ncbi:transcriptional factor 2 subunit, putative [Babesia bigemina]|uniref:Transcriptional factor 2 subunit, putative n=1 Tax=Babesia bigemina TaxID=5866 RepID=A0A061DBS9_BABBI|nr:transcriptional factor 2 subunit, putative [Babesia bigemina]CDR98028.1 transcriptional factor 2 subunit, putative [Babesia bigemina]|eukprot:XP_012770214.1 transcriptional factor 2 subunit, putative [Babesia bigemina]